jgi:hypothetical protein
MARGRAQGGDFNSVDPDSIGRSLREDRFCVNLFQSRDGEAPRRAGAALGVAGDRRRFSSHDETADRKRCATDPTQSMKTLERQE